MNNLTAQEKIELLPEPVTVRLTSLTIENYKGIDSLELRFLAPRLAQDPYVTVIGSENGLGKTSVLECCALLLLPFSREQDAWLRLSENLLHRDIFLDPFQMMIRAGTTKARVAGKFLVADGELELAIECTPKGLFVERNAKAIQIPIFEYRKRIDYEEHVRTSLLSLLGVSGEPMISPPFLYFNSYRKIQEGNSQLGRMIAGDRWHRPYSELSPMSAFKMEVVRALMGRKGLFESVDELDADIVIEELNSLIKDFAHGTLAKLRDLEEGAVELRVTKSGGKTSHSFDGLSSGQKEIISTLFLIWKYTRNQPGIVLIDEPELHLNAEWHRSFIRRLAALQPLNQYIIATHSEHVFDSVDERSRVLLQPD